MKSAVAVLLLASVNADFSERWNAIKTDPPPITTQSIMTPAPHYHERKTRERHHARHHGFVCHRIYYTEHHHRYWRCRR